MSGCFAPTLGAMKPVVYPHWTPTVSRIMIVYMYTSAWFQWRPDFAQSIGLPIWGTNLAKRAGTTSALFTVRKALQEMQIRALSPKDRRL